MMCRKGIRVNKIDAVQALYLPEERDEAVRLAEIIAQDQALYDSFASVIGLDRTLSRQLVSFQANKKRPFYRWYKYKEAFSADLVERFLSDFAPEDGPVLDPFAGAGTALFAAAEQGLDVEGIELLPIGQQIIQARRHATGKHSAVVLAALEKWIQEKPWRDVSAKVALNTLKITDGAYPAETQNQIESYLAALSDEVPASAQVLRFALLCVLESVSYTRKDGQYLRWDHRAGRRGGRGTFDKGHILDFEAAILPKLRELIEDLSDEAIEANLFDESKEPRSTAFQLHDGSCLEYLPTLGTGRYQAIMTSPPYCNRYDYTRTYALEHAVLGASHEDVVSLRQNMLSCTVENRPKDLLAMNPAWEKAVAICDDFELLQNIFDLLELKKKQKALNNNGIPRMVKGYFYEMACVIQECHRVLSAQGTMVMVNDNVRYAGIAISVDTILSRMAELLGFRVKKILVLPQNKGNSSQQMGTHGRQALRKSVYVWEKA